MEVRLPRLGEGADSGTVASIFVNVGDRVTKDQPVLELESEKAVASIPSPTAGTIHAIHVKEGDLVKVGQLIVTVDEANAPAPVPRHPREEIEEVEAHGVPGPAEQKHDAPEPSAEYDEPQSRPLSGVVPAASPSLRKIARDLGIDLTRVRGSERGGRIVTADVRRYVQRLQQLATHQQRPAPASAPAGPPPVKPPVVPVDFSKWGTVHTQKMTTLRRTISTRMAESWNAIPHVTQFDEADITDVMALRKKFSAKYEKKNAHLTLTPCILKALVDTLREHPMFNASIDEFTGEIVFKDYYHIGIAVDTEQGLLVPVIRDVDKKSVLDLSLELLELATRTRERKVSIEEMQGGSFTVSNQGGIGSGQFTPIINKPEVAILGVARGVEKMVFRKTQFRRRTMLPISLSYDHRVIDGADAARFMVAFVHRVESFDEKSVRI